MRTHLTLAVMAVLALAVGVHTSLADGYVKQKVVYHINYDDQKRQTNALRSIQNHINAVGKDKLDIRVVMHSGGYTLLKRANTDPKVQQKVADLKDQGVKFLIGASTIRRNKINVKNDLYDVHDADIVPNGVAEIADLQNKGFSYIRP